MKRQIPPVPPHLTEADQITWPLDGPDGANRRFREIIFKHLPYGFRTKIARQYRDMYLNKGERKANIYLREIQERLSKEVVDLASSDVARKEFAKLHSKHCSLIMSSSTDDQLVYQDMAEYVTRFRLKPPKIKKGQPYLPAINRMCDTQWWTRNTRRVYGELFEIGAIQTGMVHRYSGLYTSDETLRHDRKRRNRNREFLESMEAINEIGDKLSLSELHNLSVSNPKNRRNELMVRISGFESLAINMRHKGLFITLTCPSRMHARYSKSGDSNPKYDGTSPNKAQKYLSTLWARIRSRFKYYDIHAYGFRVAEPQHDGTPHWHILLFSKSEHIETIRRICTRYAMEDSPDESGAEKHRCTIVDIDWNKGTATGYIAKYISKNIDGEYVGEDLHGNDAKKSSERVLAWASIHRIRQFQQFGGPSVTIWRLLRKIESAPNGILENARTAADSGNWEQFTNVLGGIETNKKGLNIKPVYHDFDEKNRYDEPKGKEIVGLTDGEQNVLTKLHIWEISRRGKHIGDESYLQGAAL